MEKKLYELTIKESMEKVMPPLQDMELALLEQSLLTEGCRDPLVVWDSVIVDGHNRYRICRKHGIPFAYIEHTFENEGKAKLWIICNQLARRNVPDFVRCEMVLPLEAELKAEAKKHQGQRNDLLSEMRKSNKGTNTQKTLAKMAGVSTGMFHMAKTLSNKADEDTKEKLRHGKASITGAYTDMKKKERERAEGQIEPAIKADSYTSAPFTGTSEAFTDNHPKSAPDCAPNNKSAQPATPTSSSTPATPDEPTSTDYDQTPQSPLKLREGWDRKPVRNPYEIMPGIDVTRALGSLADIKYECPPDSVYNQDPVELYGIMPADNPETRSAAEIAYACSELRRGGEYYIKSVREALQKLSAFSRNEESLHALRQLVDKYYSQIMELLVL